MSDLQSAIASADRHRDAGRFLEAAASYRIAVLIEPSRSDLWVQLGNMLKDGASLTEAERAYRTALTIKPNDADCWLQLGRTLRLFGRHGEALQALTRVLELESGHTDAVVELINLGAGWVAGKHDNTSPRLIIDLLQTTACMRRMIQRVESTLPTLFALSSVPVAQYDASRQILKVPPPPSLAGKSHHMTVIMRGDAELDTILRVLNSIQKQSHPRYSVIMPDLTEDTQQQFERLHFVRPNEFKIIGKNSDELIRNVLETDGVLYASTPVILDIEALAWFAEKLSQLSVSAVLCDEDSIDFVNNIAHYKDPLLRPDCDLELLEQNVDPGRVIAVNGGHLRRGGGEFLAELYSGTDCSVAKIARMMASQGLVETIRYPLASMPSHDSVKVAVRAPVIWPEKDGSEISVIIPTRNGVNLLQSAIAAARSTARDPRRLRFIIVDNASSESGFEEFIATESSLGYLTRVIVDEPFNWSRFNRLAALTQTTSSFYLFMNNDVNLTSEGWDDQLVWNLNRKEIGAVGAKLFYPNGTIQHAGIAVTPIHLTEHDGRGEPSDAMGPGGRYKLRRCVTAVTGAFLATRRDTFWSLGGFDDENLPVWFNDVDYCLKCWRDGFRVLYDPAITAVHYEGATLSGKFSTENQKILYENALTIMQSRWAEVISREKWSRLFVGT